MKVTKQSAAQKLTAYLHHEISLAQLVDWAETALLDGEFADQDARRRQGVITSTRRSMPWSLAERTSQSICNPIHSSTV